MGIVEEELWKCKCGFEFIAESGLYEADPNDFGTIHFISGYHCPKCGQVKNVANHVLYEQPQDDNRDLCINESDLCDNCGTKMKFLDKPKFKLFSKGLLCPQCKKKTLKFEKIVGEWMT